MKLKKTLVLIFTFMVGFLAFNKDVFAFKAEEWKEDNKDGYYCIYNYTDSGNNSRRFYLSFSNKNGNITIKEATSNRNGLDCNSDCRKRSSSTVTSHFKFDDEKLYCPKNIYYCDTSGDDNYIFYDQKKDKCYAKGSDNGSDEHDRYVLQLSDYSSKVYPYDNGKVEIPTNTAQNFPVLPSCNAGGMNAANSSVSKINQITNAIENYNPNDKNSDQIIKELGDFGTNLSKIDVEGQGYCNVSGFTTTDSSKNPLSLRNLANQKINDKTQELINSKKITDEQANAILEKFKYSGVKYTDKEYKCEQLLDDDLQLIIKKVLQWTQILAPIILIVMSSVDFGQAVISQDQDAMKKATSKVLKRFIAAVALFFIPFLVKTIMGWAGFFDTCGL